MAGLIESTFEDVEVVGNETPPRKSAFEGVLERETEKETGRDNIV